MGDVKRKLLHETLKGYGLYAIVILLLSTPFFYFMIQKLHLDDVDEALILRANEFKQYTLPKLSTAEIGQWNRFNRDMKILDAAFNVRKDSLSFQFFYDTLATELEPYRVLLSPIKVEGEPYIFSAKSDLIESEDLITSLALLYSGLLFVLVAGLFFITQYYSKRLWLPFYKTLHSIEQFEIDKTLRPDLPATAIEEFSRLNQALQSLIDRSKQTYENQQEFIENAAHELQTPLAVLHAKLDTFLQQPDLTASQLQALSPLYDLLARLNRLNKNLLILSKIDHQSYHVIEEIDLGSLLWKSVRFFEDQADEKSIAIELNDQQKASFVHANLALTEILISNLLLNAVAHNHPRGKVYVEWKDSEFRISNTGQDAALLEDRLFQRFAKTDSSSKGNGLGLAIVKKIADLYGWQITYVFENGLHTFKVQF